MTHPPSPITLLTLLLALTIHPTHASAQPSSLDSTLSNALSADAPDARPDSLGLLARVGATYDGYAIAERTPRTGAFVVEIRAKWHDKTLRIPAKTSRDSGSWKITWAPDRSYAETLVQLVDADQLLQLPDDDNPSWADEKRVPALPILLTDDTAHTPFGSLPLTTSGKLKASKRLGKHIGRWIDEILENDPAPAGIDVIASSNTPWRHLSTLLLTASGAGLFRIRMIGTSHDHLAAWPALAPVFQVGDAPDRATAFVVGMYSDPANNFRVSVGERHLPDIQTDDPSTLPDKLRQLVKTSFDGDPPNVTHVMFAATGSTEIREAITYASAVAEALGIPSAKLYLGHIGEESSEQEP